MADFSYTQDLTFKDGITCRAFTEIAEDAYIGFFFIDHSVSDRMQAMKEAAQLILRRANESRCEWFCLVSETCAHFLDLPKKYRELREIVPFAYSRWQELVIEQNRCVKERHEVQIAYELEKIGNLVANGDESAAVNEMRALLRECRENQPYDVYLRSVDSILQIIRTFSVKAHLDMNRIQLKDEYLTAEQLEEALCGLMIDYFSMVKDIKDKKYSRYVLEAMDYMNKHFSEDIAVTDIAATLDISEGHLRRVFRSETGKNLIDYLTAVRINAAKRMMRNGTMTIGEIRRKTGFSSDQYFSYVFKKHEGILPKEYQKASNIKLR